MVKFVLWGKDRCVLGHKQGNIDGCLAESLRIAQVVRCTLDSLVSGGGYIQKRDRYEEDVRDVNRGGK